MTIYFQQIFYKNSQTINYIVLVNIRNIYVKYSNCGHVHFNIIMLIIKVIITLN